ncbi:SDR family NAD(P)-dependent oxidoreductase [Breoghania sp.]|uniref:SDR family NAD(P)-dependent oxidoreductase n=1 Tax=Breoghania sp. TaxID=2065378 RepID=UPI002AA735F9|nr:SDR family NAD(P)-dependent oxidoreductase [Breoghania sp.]
MRLVILGATSAIAEATARRFAAERAHILLVGRKGQRLEAMAGDLRSRGAGRVETMVCDLVEERDVRGLMEEFASIIGGIDQLLIAYGFMGQQREAELDPEAAERIFQVNFNSVAAWSLAGAEAFERQGHGTLLILGSVAGDRGRRGNYVYGAAKAGIAALAEGINHRFAGKGPRVVLVKPGPTATPMTRGMDRSGPLWSTPDQIAGVVVGSASASGRGAVAYAPWFWRYLMLIIRNLPSRVFNRLDI